VPLVLLAEINGRQRLGGESITEHEAAREKAVRDDFVEQTSFLQHPCPVWTDLNSRADFTQLGRPFEQGDGGALTCQRVQCFWPIR
jgi:hypothetical protein